MILKDLHAHSTYCDGKNTVEEMILAAIERGCRVFGISGHSYTAFDTSWCMQREELPRYLSEMRYLRAKYFDRIHVLCGVEQDYCSEYPTDDFDYVIGSVHYLPVGGEYVPADESPEILREACDRLFGGDIYALCERYYAAAADVVNKTNCDIIGHFDLIAKFNEGGALFDESHPRYVAAWKRAVDELLTADVPFEINTGAIFRGYRSVPYPSPDMIAYIKERGGRFVLSSDAHSADGIGYRFDEYKSYVE